MTAVPPADPFPDAPAAPIPLTAEQRAIVEAPDGPVVVIAGAGTGKTRVIVERVRWLLATHGEVRETGSGLVAAEPVPRHGDPFAGPLVPEQILVLTYNVKAAQELEERLNAALGPAVRSRLAVDNFHGFCHHVLSESAVDAGLPADPEVLDGVGQVLLLDELEPSLDLVYHEPRAFPEMVQFINRAKDELASPDAVDAFVAEERAILEAEHGSFEEAVAELRARGNLGPLREVRKAYARARAADRAEQGRGVGTHDGSEVEKVADREARRTVSGTGEALARGRFGEAELPRIDELAAEYVRLGAALEVLRLGELARVYRRYQEELEARGLLDFGEQIGLVIRLFRTRPNVLRRWQRRFRYLLVDEFQDANIAQIELVELLGRTPDRPDNVMVVGDDDQSIYRFRGASWAAFHAFDVRFSRPPAHDPAGPAPAPPLRLQLERNFRSVRPVVATANGLIARNEHRYLADKRLVAMRGDGDAVELVIAASPEDEAVAVVDAIRELAGPDANDGVARWGSVAVLYRKHAHREAIVARLDAEGIPYTVVGGLSLFDLPEVQDLEAALTAIADLHADDAIVRLMSAGPWRLDALEILRVTRDASAHASFVVDAIARIVATGSVEEDRPAAVDAGAEGAEPGDAPLPRTRTRRAPVPPETRARLRALLGTLEELHPASWRSGPHTVLERWLERTGTVLDLLAAGTLEAKRTVVNVASFLRFAADWEAQHPSGTLAGFAAYVEAYRGAGGELPTSVELVEDATGVRLMTVYQAKGLEFPFVVVPRLLRGQWPVPDRGPGPLPVELLREAPPGGDWQGDEERRLLYVALTRARDRLVVTTEAAPRILPSEFFDELRAGDAGCHRVTDRTGAGEADGPADPVEAAAAVVRKVMPLPSARIRRLERRVRAAELIGLLEQVAPDDPEAPAAREALGAELAALGRATADAADAARGAGLDPLTFRALAEDDGAGANLLRVAPLPGRLSYSSISMYETCPLRFALSYVYRIPEPDRPAPQLAFGDTAHAAFERFTALRRERLAASEPPPTREDLDRFFAEAWVPSAFGDPTTEASFRRRTGSLLDAFWADTHGGEGVPLHEELGFLLPIDPGGGEAPFRIKGSIDRVDRLPSGGIEVVDYKTGSAASQKAPAENLQLAIYALACRDALGLGMPERVTLYFTESAMRRSLQPTEEHLERMRTRIVERVRAMRAGEFGATPSYDACRWCQHRAICPSRME